MNFKTYLKNEVKDKQKLTIILGSGFHKYKNQENTTLNDWQLLLKKIIKKPILENDNLLLAFESNIINSNLSNTADQTQKNCLKTISKTILNYTKNIDLNDYPSFIFNPKYVSDVIVLNFDEVAEKVCQHHFGAKLGNIKYIKVSNKGASAQIHQTTRYRDVIFKNKDVIKFWHPHGSVSKADSMILGLRQYANHIKCIEELRKSSKSIKADSKEPTWYNKLTHQTVLILGAGVSDNEIDLWTAFVNRERNFAKKENKKYRKPLYQMRIKGSANNSAQQWFEPLFDESSTFSEQWKALEVIFNQ